MYILLQLPLRYGDEVKVLEKVNDTWWWVEVNDEVGYVPANHLSSRSEPSEVLAEEDPWQDGDYFCSYEALVSL